MVDKAAGTKVIADAHVGVVRTFDYAQVDYLNFKNQSVAVLHTQGESRYWNRDMFAYMHGKRASVPDYIGVVTCCSKFLLDQAELIKQLKANAIFYVNPAKHIKDWRNSMKPELIVRGIKSLPPQYTHVLCCDALDVMLNGEFARAIAGYESYGKALLFGASRNCFPKHVIDKVANRDWRGNFCYLNAGTCYGPRAAMLDFYRAVAELVPQFQGNDQEQILVRTAFAERQDWVEFDYECKMFLTFCKANVNYNDDGTIKVY